MTDKKNLYTTRHTLRKNAEIRRRLWLPPLLFGNGLVAPVLILTMVMLRRLGLDTADAALTIALLCLPVMLRPLFEMVVAHFWGTSKVWILSTQFISALSLAAIAFTLHTSSWLLGTLCFMPFFVCSAMFYDIAVHRFYIDLPQEVQLSRMHPLKTLPTTTALLFGMGIMIMVGGNMEVLTRNIRYSWSLVFYIIAGVELCLWLWLIIFLPGGTHGYATLKPTMGLHRGEFGVAMRRMFSSKNDVATLLFFLLFLLPEALLFLVAPLFLIAKPHTGGLGLSPQEFAFAQGTIAIIATTIGYLLGSKATNRYGLRCWLLPTAPILAIHGFALLFISEHTTASLSVVAIALAIGNVAQGFAISIVKSVVMLFTHNTPDYTLRHAMARTFIATPFVALALFTGLLLLAFDYQQLFLLATELSVVPLFIAAFYLFRTRK